MSANPSKKCPKCGKMKLKRLIGAGAGVIFKGSGFYETDYRSENYKQGKKDANPEKTKKESKSTDKKAKSDAKPKSESKKKTPKK
jgi:predicted nucleic acid-binding Zn ribbon protein